MKRTGQYYKFTIEDPASPGTEVLIGCMTAHNLAETKELIDATCFDATQYNDYLTGTRGGSGGISGYYNPDDDGQKLIRDVMDQHTPVPFTIAGMEVGDVEIKGSLYITEYDRSFELNAPAAFTLAYTVAGPITQGTVSA